MFEFATTSRIIFGSGSLEQAPSIIAERGRRVLLVTGGGLGRETALLTLLQQNHFAIDLLRVKREPGVEDIANGVELARAKGIEVVVGLGGGSAIDAAKAIAAVATNPGELLDYLEVIGRGLALSAPGIPCIAIPTTAGTGAEVTRNAVIDVPEQAIKVSLRGPQVLPQVAIIDPHLALTVPAAVTAATGFDALTQVIEPFLSTRANSLTDALSREAMRLAARSLGLAHANGADLGAREDMAQVSLFGGLCLSNAGLGAVHGLAGPLGGMFRAPHGAVCAVLLGPTMAANLKAIVASNLPNRDDLLQRFREIGQILTARQEATAEDSIAWVNSLAQSLRIPKLSSYGVGPERFGPIIERAQRASSMTYNPVKLQPEELAWILRTAL